MEPPAACDVSHSAIAKWIDLHLAACNVMVDVGMSGDLTRLRESQRLLAEAGLRVVAVSDSKGGVYNPNGLDLAALDEHRQVRGGVSGFRKAENVTNAELLGLPVTVLVPRAITRADASPGGAPTAPS